MAFHKPKSVSKSASKSTSISLSRSVSDSEGIKSYYNEYFKKNVFLLVFGAENMDDYNEPPIQSGRKYGIYPSIKDNTRYVSLLDTYRSSYNYLGISGKDILWTIYFEKFIKNYPDVKNDWTNKFFWKGVKNVLKKDKFDTVFIDRMTIKDMIFIDRVDEKTGEYILDISVLKNISKFVNDGGIIFVLLTDTEVLNNVGRKSLQKAYNDYKSVFNKSNLYYFEFTSKLPPDFVDTYNGNASIYKSAARTSNYPLGMFIKQKKLDLNNYLENNSLGKKLVKYYDVLSNKFYKVDVQKVLLEHYNELSSAATNV